MKTILSGMLRPSRIACTLWSAALLLFLSASSQAAGPFIPGGVQDDAGLLRMGERMYIEGILPSGEPMLAVVKGDIEVEGTAFTCASCHLRSGLGAVEGGVITPPTNGKTLFQPLKAYYKYVEVKSAPPRRPAYTDETLAELLRAGVDPAGNALGDVMPRYLLDDRDMAVLIRYLKSLSSELSPGATDESIRLGTVISEDVSPEFRDAMLAHIEKFVNDKNKQAGISPYRMQARRQSSYLTLSLAKWILKGPPETWRAQLEEYNRNEPVFALAGGITTGEWKPVHDFCEENHIPCLFPITDFPVVSETGWYTLYQSKGYYQEGESAARFLNGADEALKGGTVVQVVRDTREGRALSAGFEKTWLEMGHARPATVMLKPGEGLSGDFLKGLQAGEKPATVMLWDGPEAVTALKSFASSDNMPGMVFVASGYLGKSLYMLDEKAREFTYITYPFRLPEDEEKKKVYIPLVKGAEFHGDALTVMKRTYAVIPLLTRTLLEMKGNYYRDNFLDVIGMMMDMDMAPLYERLSFGPGQRYASKGCYIVQLTKGPKPVLVKKSGWVIH